MKKLIEILTESKQIGILYHYTNLNSLLKIMKSGMLIDGDEIHRGYVSFSRNGSGITGRGQNFSRIVIDGNKLSNLYRIIPDSQAIYNKTDRGPIKPPDKKQQEERIYKRKVNIKNCILQIDIIQDYADFELTEDELLFLKNKTDVNLVDNFTPYK